MLTTVPLLCPECGSNRVLLRGEVSSACPWLRRDDAQAIALEQMDHPDFRKYLAAKLGYM